MNWSLCVLLLLSGVACTNLPPPEPPASLPPVVAELGVRLATDRVPGGELLRASVSLNNHGQPPHRLDFATGCQFTWTITTSDGVTFTTHCMICTQAGTSIILAGSLYETTIRIATRRECTVPWPFAGDALPAGRYTLTVFAIGYEDQFLTEPVAFEITDG